MRDSELKPTAHVRKAQDCLVAAHGQSQGTHRAQMRSMIDYRLGEITGGAAGALATAPGSTANLTTFGLGFHMHDCGMQFVIILDGAVDAAREGGVLCRTGKGDVSMIPGGVPHGGTEPSADYQAVEITFPGTYQTLVCDPPGGDAALPARSWSRSAASRSGVARGVISYAYPVAAAFQQAYAVEYQRRTRAAAFEPGDMHHDDALRILMVLAGTREVEIEGERFCLGHSDMLVIPRDARCRDLAATADFEGVWIHAR